jgi:large subunit ribosomal protein L17e
MSIQIILSAADSEVERSKDKDDVAAKQIGEGLNRRQQARMRRIEAARV